MRITLTALMVTAALPLAAQPADFRWEKALAADMTVSLHNLNGRVTVTPSTSGKVEITGIGRRGSRADDVTIEVHEHDRGITVCSVFRDADMDCDESGFHMRGRWGRHRDWDDASIDMDVRLPRGMRLTANTVSGDVSVTGAEGVVRAGTVSGDVRMDGLRVASVRASTVSGDIRVSVDAVAGDGYFTFSSVSGDVTAELPRAFDADVSLSSVSGTLESDFPLTLNGRVSRNRIQARIGKGGRDVEVRTVSGDVLLRMARAAAAREP
jgi:hypothetical protein